MTRGVALYLVGSLVLVSLAGCGRGFFQFAEREPWRAEAEAACLKSGAVKESPDLVRIEPISGPGVCGADFPLKVAALGESNSSFGFADDPRPPAAIGGQPRWPVSSAYPANSYPTRGGAQVGGQGTGPVSLSAPGVAPADDEITLPADGGPLYRRDASPYPPPAYGSAPSTPVPRLGPPQGNAYDNVGPVAVKPAATLACPIVSVLDRWLADSVQPAAMRWFGARVVEIKQISAYSCRGMNGNPSAHISEHAFGNALDIAAFTLADGRRIAVKDGWHGSAEEQGFLRDIQGAACQQFSTVLAPGSNAYHYDHIHVDLMRRSSRRVICEPAAISGEQVAARVSQRSPYASREPAVTGSLGGRRAMAPRRKNNDDDDAEDD